MICLLIRQIYFAKFVFGYGFLLPELDKKALGPSLDDGWPEREADSDMCCSHMSLWDDM